MTSDGSLEFEIICSPRACIMVPKGSLAAEAAEAAAAIELVASSSASSEPGPSGIASSSSSSSSPEAAELPSWLSPLVSRLPAFTPRVRGLALLNLLCFLFATNIIVVKDFGTDDGMDPLVFAAGRFALAAVAFSPFLASAIRRPEVLKAGMTLGLLSAAAYGLQGVALISSDARCWRCRIEFAEGCIRPRGTASVSVIYNDLARF